MLVKNKRRALGSEPQQKKTQLPKRRTTFLFSREIRL
jgi:hypothetical protein